MLVSDQFNSRFWSADGEDDATNPSKKAKKDSNGSANVLAQIMRESEQGKEKVNRKDYWLCEGLVVKVMSRNLADYYKQKGVVQRVIGKYVGEIEMLDSKHVLKVNRDSSNRRGGENCERSVQGLQCEVIVHRYSQF
jgi:ribosomal protein S15P/S13E